MLAMCPEWLHVFHREEFQLPLIVSNLCSTWRAGVRLNIKTVCPFMTIFIIKKTAMWPSYLYRCNSYKCKTILRGSLVISIPIKSHLANPKLIISAIISLQWRYNERDGVSNHQPHDWLLNRFIHRWPVKSPHKGPVTRKTFPFDERHRDNQYISNITG